MNLEGFRMQRHQGWETESKYIQKREMKDGGLGG
jgi:hypothetical protein